MFEYTIRNIATDEEDFIHGYSIKDAFRRANYNRNEWTVIMWEYID